MKNKKSENMFLLALNEGHKRLDRENQYKKDRYLERLEKLKKTARELDKIFQDIAEVVDIEPKKPQDLERLHCGSEIGSSIDAKRDCRHREFSDSYQYYLSFNIQKDGDHSYRIHLRIEIGKERWTIDNVLSDYLNNASFIVSKLLDLGYSLKKTGVKNEK